MDDIAIRLVRIQSTLVAQKNQFNSFGKYPYRSCEDIIEAVKPLLAKEGMALVISDDIVEVGNRVYVKATAKITIDQSVSISATAFAREQENQKGMQEPQITGASSSYARKYALNGLFAIDDTKDADTMKPHVDKVKDVFKGSEEITIELFKQKLNESSVKTHKINIWGKYWPIIKPQLNEEGKLEWQQYWIKEIATAKQVLAYRKK